MIGDVLLSRIRGGSARRSSSERTGLPTSWNFHGFGVITMANGPAWSSRALATASADTRNPLWSGG
jgi:hypothetical protein